MKTLKTRILDLTTNKDGSQTKKYKEVFDFVSGVQDDYDVKNLTNPTNKIYFGSYTGHGRNTKATNNIQIADFLNTLNIDFIKGNDAPRGGVSGNYIELTTKGKKQLAKFRALPFAEKSPFAYKRYEAQELKKERIEKEKQAILEKYGEQEQFLKNYFISNTNFLETLKRAVDTQSSKLLKKWLKHQVVSKVFNNDFHACNLSTSQIRTVISDI